MTVPASRTRALLASGFARPVTFSLRPWMSANLPVPPVTIAVPRRPGQVVLSRIATATPRPEIVPPGSVAVNLTRTPFAVMRASTSIVPSYVPVTVPCWK